MIKEIKPATICFGKLAKRNCIVCGREFTTMSRTQKKCEVHKKCALKAIKKMRI